MRTLCKAGLAAGDGGKLLPQRLKLDLLPPAIGGRILHCFFGVGCTRGLAAFLTRHVLANDTASDRVRNLDKGVLGERKVHAECFIFLRRWISLHVLPVTDVPFGGMQGVFARDFFQLPPVPNEEDHGRFCFRSLLWPVMIPASHCIILSTICR